MSRIDYKNFDDSMLSRLKKARGLKEMRKSARCFLPVKQL